MYSKSISMNFISLQRIYKMLIMVIFKDLTQEEREKFAEKKAQVHSYIGKHKDVKKVIVKY